MTLLTDLVDTSRAVADDSRRTAKVDLLVSCLRRLAPEEIQIAVAFLTGEPRQGKLGLGYATLVAARRDGAGEATLTLIESDRRLAEIARIAGRGAAGARARQLGELFARATPAEQDFLVRLVLGELRQGALEAAMSDAIAAAANVPIAEVRRAAMFAGDLGSVARAALVEGRGGLAQFRLVPLVPVEPMLAQTAESVTEALRDLGRAAVEWKLDGARVQVHKSGDVVRVYTRSLSDVTGSVPEIVEAARALPARELVLDGETIALAPGGAPRPFQVTMRRFGRKLDVEAIRAELPLTAFFFDCLRYDDTDLVDRPAQERFTALAEALPGTLVIPRVVTDDPVAAERFLGEALARGHEGVVAKSLVAPYAAGSRGAGWLKIKQARTLDLVVLAAEWGHGRRKGWLSNLHLGARDPGSGAFVMLGKTFKGLTDATLAWQTRELLVREIGRDDWTVYVRPELVVEIAFNELQASSQYPGGLALRFARVKNYRPDKRAAEADTIDTVRAIHAAHLVHAAT